MFLTRKAILDPDLQTFQPPPDDDPDDSSKFLFQAYDFLPIVLVSI
jgi:hypothetical protein